MKKQKIFNWISENTEDQEAMDKINKMTFCFTSKYKARNEVYSTKETLNQRLNKIDTMIDNIVAILDHNNLIPKQK